MTEIRRALRAAAWKLTLARAASVACVVVAAAAAAWAGVVLAAGTSAVALTAIVAAAGVAAVVGAWRSRAGALEAARRVEQSAGWQEKLSTAVELEASQSDNAFRGRLHAEAETLLRQSSPAALIAWRLQRPAVAAATLVVAAAAVTALFPSGLFPGGGRALTPERRRAAASMEDAISRLDRMPAKLADLRVELVHVLNDIRANRPLPEVRRAIDHAIGETDARAREQLGEEARRISGDLARSPGLGALADAIARLDPERIRQAGQNVADQLTSMTDAERQGVSSSLTSAAGRAESPGLSAPMWEMAKAADARDGDLFRRFSDLLATRLNPGASGVTPDFDPTHPVRQALLSARASLGGGEAGQPERRMDFFVEGKSTSDNATGAGNLVVRGKPQDIKSVYEGTRAVNAVVPQLLAVIEDAQDAAKSGDVAPAYRDYVKRYFSPDADNR